MKFTKMHGLGNDYIYINAINEKNIDYAELSKKLSNRHFGIGADGIITISSSEKADFFMQIYNADGSKGEMCGNGIRCVGKYVYENNLTNKTHLAIDTLAGIKYLDLEVKNEKVISVTVDMGEPKLHNGEKLSLPACSHNLIISNNQFNVIDISMGNPHTVIFVPEINDHLVLEIGPQIEKNSYYPQRTNVEFAKIIDDDTIKMRVWERGSGETLACGTGACAVAVAYMLLKKVKKEITINLRGGDLKIKWDSKTNHIFMQGPATKVYEGTFNIEDIINN